MRAWDGRSPDCGLKRPQKKQRSKFGVGMERQAAEKRRIGDWCVNPMASQISREGEVVRVEERAMRLLLCLAEHAGEVVSIDQLLDHAWEGVIVTPDSVY